MIFFDPTIREATLKNVTVAQLIIYCYQHFYCYILEASKSPTQSRKPTIGLVKFTSSNSGSEIYHQNPNFTSYSNLQRVGEHGNVSDAAQSKLTFSVFINKLTNRTSKSSPSRGYPNNSTCNFPGGPGCHARPKLPRLLGLHFLIPSSCENMCVDYLNHGTGQFRLQRATPAERGGDD